MAPPNRIETRPRPRGQWRRSGGLHLIFFCSGFAGLGYQMAWSKLFATGLGHELPAVLAVVAAFMGGMGFGAAALDRPVSRSRNPARWYAGLELTIGLWGFFSPGLIGWVNDLALPLIGLEPSPWRHWVVAFVLPFLALLPATAAMGASLPAMERFVSPLSADGRCVAALYAANTGGAVAGALVTVFTLFPGLGLRETTWLLAAVNVFCGAIVLALRAPDIRPDPRGAERTPGSVESRTAASYARGGSKRGPGEAQVPQAVSRRLLNVCLLVTGLLGIGYETVGVRVLSQVLENTIYTFAAVLAVFLLGTALGAGLFQRFGRRRSVCPLLGNLVSGLALTCLLGILAVAHSPGFYNACRGALGDSMAGVALAEMLTAATVFGLPSLFSGAVFSQLAQASRRAEAGVGEALAFNTVGGALAPALFGVMLLPTIGSKWSLVGIAVGYLALLPATAALVAPVPGGAPARGRKEATRRPLELRWLVLASIVVALALALPTRLELVQLSSGENLAEYREGVMASVAVVRDRTGSLTLRVNNRFQMGGTGATDAERRHAHLPLLLHPAPRRALFLGLGTGITFGASTLYPGLRADGVELLPEVVAVMHWFAPNNYAPAHQPHLRLFEADARRFVRTTTTKYDVIVADLFQPARDGAGALYTVQHFRAIRERLAPGGLFCQWLPLHQLDEPMLRVIMRTFQEVFPDAHAWLLRFNVDAPVLGLVGTLQPARYSTSWVEHRLDGPALSAQLKQLALADSIRLFGCLVAGPHALAAFAGNAPVNTDDHPVVMCGAPRFVYQRQATPYGRLLTLLQRGDRDPADLLTLDPADRDRDTFRARLAAFIGARDVYLNGLVAETRGRTSEAIDAFVESARRSRDFTLGYAQCLDLAVVEAKSDPAAARALLERLVAAQPSQPVAGELLRRLFRP